MEFNPAFKTIKGDVLTLKLIETYVGDERIIRIGVYKSYQGYVKINKSCIILLK